MNTLKTWLTRGTALGLTLTLSGDHAAHLADRIAATPDPTDGQTWTNPILFLAVIGGLFVASKLASLLIALATFQPRPDHPAPAERPPAPAHKRAPWSASVQVNAWSVRLEVLRRPPRSRKPPTPPSQSGRKKSRRGRRPASAKALPTAPRSASQTPAPSAHPPTNAA